MADNISFQKIKRLTGEQESFFIFPATNKNIGKILDVSSRSEEDILAFIHNYSSFVLTNNNNKIIGFACINTYPDCPELIDISINKKFHNQGIGYLYLKHLLILLNINSIILEVAKNNLSAIKMYKKFSHKTLNIRENYYTDHNNNKTDAIVLQICLKDDEK